MEASNGWFDLPTLWLVAPGTHGPVLIRGAQLDGTSPVGASLDIDALLLPVPTSVSDRAPETLMLLSGREPQTKEGWLEYFGTTSIKRAGCYGLQLDGLSFSYVVVFQAVP